MNTFAKIMIAGAATLATAVGTARIVSKVAKDQDDAFFTEHAENGVGLGGGFDLGSINHFSKAPTNVPEAEPVQDVAFEDENGQFVPLPEAEEPPAEEPVTAPAEEALSEEPTPEVEETPAIEEVPTEEAVPVIAAVPALEAPTEEEPVAEEPAPVAEEEPVAEEPAPVVEEEPTVEEPAPEEVEAPAPAEDHFEDIYSDSSKEAEAVQQEAAPAPQEPTPEPQQAPAREVAPEPQPEPVPEAAPVKEEAPVQEATTSPKKKKGPNTIQVGNAIVSDDTSNGFIELVAHESGKAPEQLVVLASPKASLMVFSFADAEHRTENTLDAVYFVSEKGRVTEASAEEMENVMAFARTFISHNQEFKDFLLR